MSSFFPNKQSNEAAEPKNENTTTGNDKWIQLNSSWLYHSKTNLYYNIETCAYYTRNSSSSNNNNEFLLYSASSEGNQELSSCGTSAKSDSSVPAADGNFSYVCASKKLKTCGNEDFPSFRKENFSTPMEESPCLAPHAAELLAGELQKVDRIHEETLPPTHVIPALKVNASARFMQGRRPKQEDRHVCIDNLYDLMDTQQRSNFKSIFNCNPASFYAIFDGHLGSLASEFCVSVLPKNIILFLLKCGLTKNNAKNVSPYFSSSTSSLTPSSSTSSSSSSSSTSSSSSSSSTSSSSTSSSSTSSSSTSSTSSSSTSSSSTSSTSSSSTSFSSTSFSSTSSSFTFSSSTSSSCSSSSSSSSSSFPVTAHVNINEEEKIGTVTLKKIEEAIKAAFLQTDREFLTKYRLARDGCTAVHTLILGNYAFIASLGDSRCLIATKCFIKENSTFAFKSERANEDHKPSREDEKKRIEKNGGKVVYVNGIARVAVKDYEEKAKRIKMETCLHGGAASRPTFLLAVSRAFGDRELKESKLLIATPSVCIKKITINEKFIVMACDGIWDVLTDQEVTDLTAKYIGKPVDASSAIVKKAFENKSQDNLTAIVIFFDDVIE